MTCENCIHNGVCFLQEVTNDIEEQLEEFGCENYKNKENLAEVKYGEWIEDGYNDIPCVCSYCGSEAPYKVISCHDKYDYNYYDELVFMGTEIEKEYIQTKYCPNCGAKMKIRDKKLIVSTKIDT